MRQEFEASLGHIAKDCLYQKKVRKVSNNISGRIGKRAEKCRRMSLINWGKSEQLWIFEAKVQVLGVKAIK